MNATPVEYHKTLIKLENVSLSLGGRLILRDINLEIRDIHRPDTTTGQVVGLLGPSGVGKTRLFRIMAGIDKPDTGQVLIGETLEPVERGMVGVVAQNYPLFNHRTVLGNLIVAGHKKGQSHSEVEGRAMDYLKRFGLEDKRHRYPTELSGGQRQRIAIAQQVMSSEHFLLMDEPFSGLDPIAIDKVCELIAEVANAHTLNTIIVVTHDISAALEVADTLWLLGRDRSAEEEILPGARCQETYDLIERGLAWRSGVTSTPEFLALLRDVRERFVTL